MDHDGSMVDRVDQPGAVDAAELLHAAKQPPISLNVRLDLETGLVRLDFSTPTSSVSMDQTAARAMAQALRQAANEADRVSGARRDRPARRRW